MVESSNETKTIENNESHPMQSIAVISIAGFGGALAGTSMSRRGIATMHHIQLSNQLPLLWAIGCASFAGIVEFSTLVSPTGFIIASLRENGVLDSSSSSISNDNSSISNDITESRSSSATTHGHDFALRNKDKSFQEKFIYWDEKSTNLLGDYAIGGALAGAMFKGSQIRPSPSSTTPSATASTSASANAQNNINMYNTKQEAMSAGTMKQKRAIGQGKVITLANKKHVYQHRKDEGTSIKKKKKILSSNHSKTVTTATTEKIIKNGATSFVKYNKTGIIAGLMPGISLGIVAGLFQIAISRLNQIAEQYEEDAMESSSIIEEENDNLVESEQEDDELIKQVKSMTTEEIKRSISLLKQGSKDKK
jgi:hypothetical protein